MGLLFAAGGKSEKRSPSGMPTVELLHKMECRACPLNNATVSHPKMDPTGSRSPIVYILGEAPGENEDRKNEQFVGDSGQILRSRIHRDWLPHIRWNNVVRTRPPKNRTPETIEIECCRPSIVRDIEATKPKAIFGFGNIPLHWAIGRNGIRQWRGRYIPIQVGSHACWYFAFEHPSYLLRVRSGKARYASDIGSENERMFALDMRRAFEIVQGLPQAVVHTPKMAEQDVDWVLGGPGDARKVVDFLMEASMEPVTGLDYETNTLRPYTKDARIMTAAVSTRQYGTLAYPIEHRQSKWSGSDLHLVIEAHKEYLRSRQTTKMVHHLAFELEWSGVYFDDPALVTEGNWGDTLTQAFVLDSRSGRKELSLSNLTIEHFGLDIKSISNVDTKNIAGMPIEDVLRYNGIDSKYHRLLGLCQEERIRAAGMEKPYEILLRRVPTVVLTQMKGVPVDQTIVAQFERKFEEDIKTIEADIAATPIVKEYERLYRERFNPGSSKHVITMMRDMLKVAEGAREIEEGSRSEGYSTDSDVLEKVDNPVAPLIIRYRTASKNKSTYIDPLREGSPTLFPDGLVHPELNTTMAQTWRTSSEGPNSQNYPKRDSHSKEVRKQFRAPKGYFFCAFDYGQIQARNIAMESRDVKLVKSFWDRHDIHMDWTQRFAAAYPARLDKHKDEKSPMKAFRTDVKNQWTFPLFFGATLGSVSEYLQIPENIIKPFYNEFWGDYTGVLDWQNRLLELYREKGYVQNLEGGRRHGPLSKNQVINSPIQGDESLIVIEAMNRLSAKGDPDLIANLEIHDDLTFVLPDKRMDECIPIIITEMLGVDYPWINVPLTVELSIGQDWCDLEEIGTYSSDQWNKR